MMETCLELKNVTKQYGHFTLDNVSMKIPKGCIIGLIGENGAGKTTLIQLILNLIEKNSGEITVFGKDHKKYEKEMKQKLGVVLDEGNFYDMLNAKHVNKIMKKIYKNWDETLFFKYLQRFSISPEKKIKEYSLGMKKKLSLCIAMSHSAELLILDEAMSGLDPIVRNEILDVFMEFIQDEKKSILISSHITNDLEKISDYIIFLHEGKIVFNKNKDCLLEEYGLLKCPKNKLEEIEKEDMICFKKNEFGYEILVDNKQLMQKKYKDFVIDSVNLEELMYFYVKGETL